MGFDPRQWTGSPPSGASTSSRDERVTSNVEALLAENDALRRELQRMQRELERLRRQQRPRPEPTMNLIRRVQVQRWGDELAKQPGWSEFDQAGLEALIERLNRRGFPANLNLQQRLNRLVDGLGSDLLAAVANPATLLDTAVLAAFALYGVRASEWLDEDPRRVVASYASACVALVAPAAISGLMLWLCSVWSRGRRPPRACEPIADW